MAECIHGLMVESCDVCSPKAPPERFRASRVRASAPQRAVRETRSPATKPAVVNAGARRIFHLTHLRNLPGILAAGRLLADAAGARPVVDLSTADTRRLRREATVSGRPVADFVPFFLTPDAPMWLRMRGLVPDSRLAEEAQALPASEFLLLVSSVRAAGEGALLADDKSELLVPAELPFSEVALVGVANERVRAEVRAVLEPAGFGQKVSVYPPWFERV